MGSPFVAVYRRDLNPYINPRSQGGFVRFFIAMFSHETNTFSTLPSDRRQFEARDLRYGGELLEAYRGTGTCLGGMIDVAEARGVTLVPSLAAAAAPAGRVAAAFYAETTRCVLADLAAAGRIRPATAWRQSPLLPPIAGQLTARGPLRRLYDMADELARDPRVVSISVFAGFPLADIRDAGLSSYVVTDGDQALAEALADRLAAAAWAHRREFLHEALPVPAAVARALAADGRPVILADIADNTGGGAAGDTTEILRELLRAGARQTTVACLWDREAVRACVAAGVGATVTLKVGGKVDPSHGAPVEVTGQVRTLSDGRFVHKGPMFRGLEGRLGPTAVLDVNDLKIILISLRWQTLDPEMLRFVGIDPLAERIIVVKSSIHYRAAFEPLAHAIIEADAPGLSSSNLARFTFKRVRRPIYPLDEL